MGATSSSTRRSGRVPGPGRRSVTRPNPTASTCRDSRSSSHARYIASYWAPDARPPSRIHVSAYSAGSCASRCTTQASSGSPSEAEASSSQRPTTCSQVAAGRHLPVAEQLGDATGPQVVAGAGDDPAHHLVAREAAVAVLHGRDVGAARGDDERRVRHDQVEPLALHRVEQVALAQLDGAGGHPGQPQRQVGHRQRPLRQVGGHHVVGVLGGVQRLHPAPGAEVEGARGPAPDGRAGEGGGRPPDAEDVVLVERLAGGGLAEVAHHPPVGGRAPAVGVAGLGRVRAQVEPGHHGVVAAQARSWP